MQPPPKLTEPPIKQAPFTLRRPVVLVGLMGAGKTSIGRRLGLRLGLPFHDSDDAVVEAAGMSIADIFETYGETKFRELERRVIERLLRDERGVLALGGGAFIDPSTRAAVKRDGISIWIKADLDTLVERTGRKPGKRPLLMNGNPRQILQDLMAKRDPVYALADHMILSGAPTPEYMVEEIVTWLRSQDLLVECAA